MKVKTQISALAVAVATTTGAWAIEPQSVRINDALVFTPTLNVVESYDDNFRAVEDHEKSSWITSIIPTLQFTAEGRKSGYELTYQAVSDIFHSSGDDNNTDHHINFDASFEFNSRNSLTLNAGYHDVEETASDGADNINDQYTTKNFGGVYTYGAETARMQLDIGGNFEKLRYSDGTLENENKERDTTALASTFYYSVTPKTKLLLEGRHTDYDYETNSRLDSTSVAGLLGATWEATAKTTGTVKLGREKKDFDDSSIDNASKGMWEVGILWMPRTYSRVNLTTRQGFDEGDSGASIIESREHAVSWEHDWTARLTSQLEYSQARKDYQDITREDDLQNYGIGLTYQVYRWLDVGIGYQYSETDSNVSGESFERNIYAITVGASL